MRRVVVLGSTGSIGRSTLDVIERSGERLQLVGMAARSRIDLLAQQAVRFPHARIGMWDATKAEELRRLSGRDVLVGTEGLEQLATSPEADVIVVATSGPEALVPLIRAIESGKHIALASKELLVMAGELVMRLVQEHGTTLCPIDSEHAALFQCLLGIPRDHVAQLTITGSGGPLWGKYGTAWTSPTRAEVLAHPKWHMGPKITVDSATLMNKGLELIEAHWLFGLPWDRLRLVIHPEAVVHAMVELVDGTMVAQMSPCDMRVPIQYALSFPDRWPGAVPRLDLARLGALRFYEPEPDQFPCLRLALEVARIGGTACVVLNGANDVAVQAYLAEQLPFAEIPRVIEETLEQHAAIANPTFDEIVSTDAGARHAAHELIHQWTT